VTPLKSMSVTLRLPARLLYQGEAVKLSARAENGAFGVLPQHIDCVTALSPGVLILTDQSGQEQIFGVDEGIMVKREGQVDICVRRAARGNDLDSLGISVKEAFVDLDERERIARTALSRLEADMVRNFMDLQRAR